MKRWLARIVVFLLLGAIVNVAVAWGSACLVVLGDWNQTKGTCDVFNNWGDSPEFDFYTAHRWERATGLRIELYRLDGYHGIPFKNTCTMQELVPHWATEFVAVPGLRGFATTDDPPAYRYVDAHGWPCRSLWGGIWQPYPNPAQPELSRAYWSFPLCNIHSRAPILARKARMLPLRPLWPGFAINTVFYAVILWLLFAWPFVVRRWRRIRRGLCPKCAYDLRATMSGSCPECGNSVVGKALN